MSWFEDYQAMSDKEQDLFQETVNLLLGKTYLVYEREGDRKYYRFVERHLATFQGYLAVARWDLYQVKRLSVIQVYNKLERNRRNLSLQETIFLLILRLLYDQRQQELRLTQQVMVTVRDIQEKYLALQIRNRLPSQEDMQRILRLFSNFSLLELKKGGWTEADAVFVLYPSLELVMTPAHLETLGEWLRERIGLEGIISEEEEQDASLDEDEID